MSEEPQISLADCPKQLLLFRAALSRIFRDISESVSADEFADSWTILKKKSNASNKLYALVVEEMQQKMISCMDDFIVEDGLIKKFNILQKMSQESDAPENHEAWRPPGDVEEHLRSLDAAMYRKCLEELRKSVTNMEAENQRLMQQVSKGRAAAKRVEQKADCLLDQRKSLCSEFEKVSGQLECDIKKLNG